METVSFVIAIGAAVTSLTLAVLWRVDPADRAAAALSGAFCAHAVQTVLRVWGWEWGDGAFALHARMAVLALAITLFFAGSSYLVGRTVTKHLITAGGIALLAAMVGTSIMVPPADGRTLTPLLASLTAAGLLPSSYLLIVARQTGRTGLLRTTGVIVGLLAATAVLYSVTGATAGWISALDFIRFALNLALFFAIIILVVVRRALTATVGTPAAIGDAGHDPPQTGDTPTSAPSIPEEIDRLVGDDYLQHVVRFLARALDMDTVFVGEITDDGTGVRIRAIRAPQGGETPRRREIANSAIERALTDGFFAAAERIRSVFPRDPCLATLDAEGFIGAALGDPDTPPVGVLVLLSRKPIAEVDIARTTVSAVAPRITAELGRGRLEVRLRAGKDLFRAVFDQMPLGIAMKDRDNRYVMANRTFCDWFGVDHDWLIGRNTRGVADRFQLTEVQIAVSEADNERVFQEGRQIVSDDIPLNIGGEKLPTRVTRFPVRDADNQISMAGMLLTDLTEVEPAAQSPRDDQRIQAVDQLVRESTHEFNNILGAISGYAQFLHDDAEDGSSSKDYANRLKSASQRARQLVQQLRSALRQEEEPRETANSDATVRKEPARPARERGTWLGRVLVIDDDLDFGDMVLTALDRAGYECAICHDPKEAVSVVQDDPTLWDAVVTDQTMPGMTGLEVVAAIKACRPEVVCVLCSGYSVNVDEGSWRNAGADAFLAKPLQPSELAVTISALLGQPDPAQ